MTDQTRQTQCGSCSQHRAVDRLAAEVAQLRATLHAVRTYAVDARDGRNENPSWTLGSAIAARIDREVPDTAQDREPGVPQVFGYILGRVTGSGVQPVESWDSRVFESEAETEAHARREGDPIGYEPLALVQVSGTDQHGRAVRPSGDTVQAPTAEIAGWDGAA